MANIIYRKSKAGFDNCFEIEFAEKEVIPSAFYENGSDLIWCRHYPCRFGDIPFTMIYDTDYDTVSFSVEPENCKYREKIAEKLLSLTEAAE